MWGVCIVQIPGAAAIVPTNIIAKYVGFCWSVGLVDLQAVVDKQVRLLGKKAVPAWGERGILPDSPDLPDTIDPTRTNQQTNTSWIVG